MAENTSHAGGEIHRLLDDAFAGIQVTPEVQDLKEEVRANLVARVDELEATGTASAEAARRAIEELGDVRALLGEPDAESPEPGLTGWGAMSAAAMRNKVRPKPRFVVGVAIAAIVLVGALNLAVFAMIGAMPLPIAATIILFGLVASGAAWIVGDSLSQETTTNYPMPGKRAGAYALATFLGVYGGGFGTLVAFGSLPVWAIVFAALGAVGAIILFAFLGATQTNRHKAWVRNAYRAGESYPGNRFEEEPETAARFGIYTMVIWVTAFVGFIIVSFTVGWAWSWLVFVGGFVGMMLLLARMLFGPRKH